MIAAGWRSILFVPGDRPERYAKALEAGADAVCIDLEDAVAPGRRAGARASAARFLAARPRPSDAGADKPAVSSPAIVVRVNDLATSRGEHDSSALTGSRRPDAFMIPKVRSVKGVRRAQRLLGDDMPLIPIIETALGLENAARIAASPSVAALVFGGFDLSAELGAEPDWESLLYARSRVVHAAAQTGIAAIDMPSRELRKMSGLRAEGEKACRLGYSGKVAVHPAQVPPIHEVFTPSREDIRRARRIIDADRAAGGGAVALHGKMVDRPVVEAARRTLARGRTGP